MKNMKHRVFWPPFILLVGCIALNLFREELFQGVILSLNAWITTKFGWFILLLAVVIFCVCVMIFFSDFGKIRIGGEDAKPVMSTFSWFTINICTTIACGIVFWSAAEPIQHLLYPPESLHLEAMSPEAAKFAMSAIYTHWTVLPYGIYTIAAVMFAYGVFNLKGSYSLGSMIRPLMGNKENGPVNTVIDCVCIFALVAGLAGSLGVGVLNLCGGLHRLLGLDIGMTMKTLVMAVTCGTFLASALSGIMKGVRRLSNINVFFYAVILVFVFCFGGTQFICSFGIESLGEYISSFFSRALYSGAFAKDSWVANWPVFYMCSWMAWAPITAVFLGKIAYGRKIRELIGMNLFAASVFSAIWFMILSGSTINFSMNTPNGGGIAEAYLSGVENTIYQLFENMPATGLLTVIFLIAVFLSFVTAADSTTIALSELSTTGLSAKESDSPGSVKVVWAAVTAVVSLIMMNVGSGTDGLKIITNIGGLPAAVFLLFVTISAVKVMVQKKK